METVSFACWGCGKTLRSSMGNAGKKCKCSKCDRVNTIPSFGHDPKAIDAAQPARPSIEVTDEVDDEDEADSNSQEEYVPLISSRHFKEYKVKEPWYFKIIEAWAYFNIGLGILIFIGLMVAFTVEIVNHSNDMGFKKAFGLAVALYIYWLIGIFGFLASWAFMLLILDAARNLRGIRHAAMKMVE